MKIVVTKAGLYAVDNELVTLKAGDEIDVGSCVMIEPACDPEAAREILNSAIRAGRDELCDLVAVCVLVGAAEDLIGKNSPPEGLVEAQQAALYAVSQYGAMLTEEMERLRGL